jgi:hypothetical protein
MRRYLAALWLRQHGVCVSMREWSAPRWRGMRKGLIARGLVRPAAAAEAAAAEARHQRLGAGYYMLTSSGEQILLASSGEQIEHLRELQRWARSPMSGQDTSVAEDIPPEGSRRADVDMTGGRALPPRS